MASMTMGRAALQVPADPLRTPDPNLLHAGDWRAALEFVNEVASALDDDDGFVRGAGTGLKRLVASELTTLSICHLVSGRRTVHGDAARLDRAGRARMFRPPLSRASAGAGARRATASARAPHQRFDVVVDLPAHAAVCRLLPAHRHRSRAGAAAAPEQRLAGQLGAQPARPRLQRPRSRVARPGARAAGPLVRTQQAGRRARWPRRSSAHRARSRCLCWPR